VYRLAFENGRARNYPVVRLELAATENPVGLRLNANELAFHYRELNLNASENFSDLVSLGSRLSIRNVS
jgi:hypothetical protein